VEARGYQRGNNSFEVDFKRKFSDFLLNEKDTRARSDMHQIAAALAQLSMDQLQHQLKSFFF
jgi:hypothetical protein